MTTSSQFTGPVTTATLTTHIYDRLCASVVHYSSCSLIGNCKLTQETIKSEANMRGGDVWRVTDSAGLCNAAIHHTTTTYRSRNCENVAYRWSQWSSCKNNQKRCYFG